MSNFYPLQSNFSGGELSPRLSARTDIAWYRKSMERVENFMATPQGSLIKRAGTEYKWPTYQNTAVRLVQFERGVNQDYVVEFGDQYIRMFNRDGIVQGLGGELLVNREFIYGTEGLQGWTVDEQIYEDVPVPSDPVDSFQVVALRYDTPPPALRVEQLQYATEKVRLYVSQTVEGIIGVEHTLYADYVFEGEVGILSVQLLIGDGVNADAYFDATYTETGFVVVPFTPVVTSTVTVEWKFQVAVPPQSGNPYPNFATIQNLSLRPSADDPLILTTGDPADTSVPWTLDEVFEIDTAMDLGGDDTGPDRLWITHPNYPPHLLIRVSENDWKCVDLIAGPAPIFITPPPDWVPGNYPSTVELFSGRSWFSGAPDSRSQLWASDAGNYFTFTAPATPLPGNSLDLQLVTRGTIQWLKGQKAMLIGTDLGEHTITSSLGYRVALIGDIDVLEQSAHGSAPVEPLIIGHEVVYTTPDRRKVMATDYLRDNDGWISQDLTWVAEHITEAQINEMIWARDPNNHIICLMGDGRLTLCTYDKQLKTNAWTRQSTQHKNDFGTVIADLYESACVNNDPTGSSPWFCIHRGDSHYIETALAGGNNTQYMDSWLQTGTVNNVVTGLDHLEGYTVQVAVRSGANEDFAVEPDQVVEGGQITTQCSGNAVVGLEYQAYAKTLRLEGGNQAGSSQASYAAFSKIILRLNDSAVPLVNGKRPAIRTPSMAMNESPPKTTGDSDSWDIKSDTGGQLVIIQELPIRTEIIAIFGKVRSAVI